MYTLITFMERGGGGSVLSGLRQVAPPRLGAIITLAGEERARGGMDVLT